MNESDSISEQQTRDNIGLKDIKEVFSVSASTSVDLKTRIRYVGLCSRRVQLVSLAAAFVLLLVVVITLAVVLQSSKDEEKVPGVTGGQTQNCPNNSTPTQVGKTLVCKCDPGFVNEGNQCKVRYEWPAGIYGLPQALSGCPMARFNWSTGWRYEHTEPTLGPRDITQGSHLKAVVGVESVNRYFCIKTDAEHDEKRPSWPKGQYCIYRKGDTCPEGMSVGWIKWDDEDRGNLNVQGGSLPEGTYDMNTLIHYCCRTDGDKLQPVSLSTVTSFFLLAYGSASCQKVKFALASQESLRFHTEQTNTKNEYGGSHPYGAGQDDNAIHYCYYSSCNYTLNTDWGTIESPNFPLPYPDGQMCTWRISVRDGYRITLKFPSFDLQNRSDADTVRVYNGVDESAELVGEFSGSRNPPLTGIVSSGSNLFMLVTSDASEGGTGFIATYTSRANSTSSFNECTGNPCRNGGACVDQPDGYSCRCAPGFNGTICQSIIPECFNAMLGIANSTVKDFHFSASSVYNDDGIQYGPQEARAGSPKGWLAKHHDYDQWLQIDFNGETLITGLTTQGYKDPNNVMNYWVTSFMLNFTEGTGAWNSYKENGYEKTFQANSDVSTPVNHNLLNAIRAVFLRILPTAWNRHIGMRVEVSGCLLQPKKKGPDVLGHWALGGTDASITLMGGPLFGDGRYPGSKAIYFNKTSNSYARVPKIYLSGKSFTIACWIKSRVTPGKYQAILGDWYWPWQFVFSVNVNRELSFSRHTSNGGSWYGVGTKAPYLVPGDTWVHVAVAWDKPNGVVKLYLNGVQAAYNTFVPSIVWFDSTRKTTYEIGEDGHWTNAQFHGSIMDMYVLRGAMDADFLNTLRGFPKFINGYKNNTIVYEGDMLTCEATGLPTPYIAWVWSGDVIVNKTSSAQVKIKGYGTRYSCVATNSVGKIETSVWVKQNKHCLSNPCETGWICKEQFTGRSCACPAGFTGRNCETDINECSSNPCQRGGTCIDLLNGYNCSCIWGYTGTHCQLQTNCSSFPCLNGGSCRDLPGGFECTCPANYTGVNCQLAPNSIKRWMLDGKDADVFLEGGPTYVKGRYPGSKALNFNKTNSCRAKVPQIDLRGISFTIATWLKSESTPGQHQAIFSDWYSPWNFWFAILKNRELHFGRHSRSGGWYGFSSNHPVPINTWCHVAVTWNQRNGIVELFLDGVLDARPSFNPGIVWYPPVKAYYEIGENGHWNNLQFHGSIMDVNVLNAPLTTAEINQLKGEPKFIRTPQNNSFVFGDATLICQAYGLPTPQVSWMRSGVVLVNSTSVASVTVDQYGKQYSCIASNYIGTTALIVNTKKNKECSDKSCSNGKCTEQISGYTCNCIPGYTGSKCEIDIDECSSNPCQHGGTCTNLLNGYKCICAGNYSGINCEATCKPSWQFFNGSCYRCLNSSVSWTDAKTQCRAKGANLASIHSSAENTFLSTLRNVTAQFWIGFNDVAQTGTHSWSDGSTVNYKNWAPGQPNRGNELAVVFYLNGLEWHDFPVTFLWPYVCKYKA